MNKAKLLKLIGVVLCAVGSVFIGYVAWHLIYSATSVTCLESKPEDSFDFGKALAINDNYIAVGDPKANRVAIYSYDKVKNQWSRTREIYPSKNSIIYRTGYGFGKHLVFNQDRLIVGAFSDYIPYNLDEDIKRKYRERGFVYSLQLGRENQNALKQIDLPEDINPTGYVVNVFDNKLALQTTIRQDNANRPSNVLVINPDTLKIESIIKPPIVQGERINFGYGLAGSDRDLAITTPDISEKGGIYLFDRQGKIETISMSKNVLADDTRKFGSPIAIGDDFFAIYSGGWNAWLSIFKQSLNGWKEIYSINLLGSLSVDKSQLLLSTGRYPFDKGTQTKLPNHLLFDVKEDKVFVKSEIRWQRGILFGFAKGLYYGSAKAQGAINSQYLLLAKNGKVVVLKKRYLPRNYVINRSFCKEK